MYEACNTCGAGDTVTAANGYPGDFAPQKHTILFVDDEMNITNALCRVMEGEDYTLLVSNSPLEALAIVQSDDVDLVISDQLMSGMKGTCLLEKIREIAPKAVRVLLSGYTGESDLLDAINKAEVYRYIQKPWDVEELRQSVADCLEHYDKREKQRQHLGGLEQTCFRTRRELADCQVRQQVAEEVFQTLEAAAIVVDASDRVMMFNRAVLEQCPDMRLIRQDLDLAGFMPPDFISAFEKSRRQGASGGIATFRYGTAHYVMNVSPVTSSGWLIRFTLSAS